jgi:hypothetical protein
MFHRGERSVLGSITVGERHTVGRELVRGRDGGCVPAWVQTRRPVAIKIMRPEIVAGLGAERFLLEIRILACLQHPQRAHD